MKKGFTIIELLIVIAVIAILVGIALPRFIGMQEEGNISRAKGELRTLQAGVESYYIHNNSTFPAGLSNLTGVTPNIVGSSLPRDPFTAASNYGYATSASERYYVIYSVGIGADGSASIDDNGTISETNGAHCIYVSNAGRDTQP